MASKGWKSKVLGSESIEHECPSCGSASMRLMATRTTFSVLGIPLLPLWKQFWIRCPKCNYRIESADMSPHDLLEIDHFASRHRTPFWVVPAAGATLVLLVLAVKQVQPRHDPALALRAAPRAGDVLVLRDDSMNSVNPFRVVRVDGVQGEVMDLSFSQSSYPSLEEAKGELQNGGLAKNGYFSNKRAAMARKTFAEMDVRFGERLDRVK